MRHPCRVLLSHLWRQTVGQTTHNSQLQWHCYLICDHTTLPTQLGIFALSIGMPNCQRVRWGEVGVGVITTMDTSWTQGLLYTIVVLHHKYIALFARSQINLLDFLNLYNNCIATLNIHILSNMKHIINNLMLIQYRASYLYFTFRANLRCNYYYQQKFRCFIIVRMIILQTQITSIFYYYFKFKFFHYKNKKCFIQTYIHIHIIENTISKNDFRYIN